MSLRAITLRNYRSFGASGARLELDHEFTAIIGVNNAGKSAMLRAFWELRPVFQWLSVLTASNGNLQALLSPAGCDVYARPQVLGGERVDPAASDATPTVTIEFVATSSRDAVESLTLTLGQQVHRMTLRMHNGSVVADTDQILSLQTVPGQSQTVARTRAGNVEIDWGSVAYDVGLLANSMYVGPFRNIVISGGANYYDVSTGIDFIRDFDDLKNGQNYRAREAVQRLQTELAIIFGYDRLDISANPERNSLTIVGDGRSFMSSELGAGLAQFVVVAANVTVRRPFLLAIDEPESNLHASLQTQFLTLLASSVTGPVLFATHSLGLARSAADQVVVATRTSSTSSELTPFHATNNLATTLGQLGYAGPRDDAYRAVLLVEGTTDVKTFQQLLQKYGVRNQVAILGLGGDSLASADKDFELDQMRRLADSVFAIVDSERDGPDRPPATSRARFAETCRGLGIECTVLERRSIENYFDPDAARAIMPSSPGAPWFGDYGKPSELGWHWAKSRNWRVAAATPREHIAGTDLDQFLETVAEAVHRNRPQ